MKKVISVLIASLTLLSFVSCEEKEKGLFESTNSDEIMFDNANSENSNSESSLETIDPFDGLEVQFDGASPYLTIGFNNSKCRQEVQDYVTFTCEQETVANGDTVTVKAEYNINSLQPLGLAIEQDEKTYEVSGCAEYVTNANDIDLTELNVQIEDKLASETTQVKDSWEFGGEYLSSKIVSVSKPKLKASYFVSLKTNQYQNFDEESDYSCFNYYIRLYDFNIKCDGSNDINKATVTSCVIMKNIKKESDGTLTYSPKLDYDSSKDNYEQALNDNVTSKRDICNINKLS